MSGPEIHNITVVGAGLMGHGIALDFALAGYDVRLHSRSEASLRRGFGLLNDSVQRLIDVGALARESAESVLDKIKSSALLEESVADADLVVETVYEQVDLKREVFRELGRLAPEHAILASNTSSIMPSEFTSSAERPERVLVAHYANPPFLMPVVELVRSEWTSDETLSKITAFYKGIGKRPIVAQKEVPGFILNRLQVALLREALWLVKNGVASAQDVDFGIKSSIGRRWAVAGVFEVLELAGLDLVAEIGSGLFPHLATDDEIPDVLKAKVAAGDIGAKSGRGFYDWTPESADELRSRIARALVEIESWQNPSTGEPRPRFLVAEPPSE